jgi:group I intron endonuclease
MIIYKITNLVNGKIYVGKDKHNNPAYFGSGSIIKQAIEKYGIENFIKDIIDYANTEEELNEKEKYWIATLNSQDKNIGYNIKSGGQGGFTINVYDSWIEKYGKDIADKKWNDLNKERSSIGEKNGNFKKILLSDDEVIDLYKKGHSMNDIATLCNVSKVKIKAVLLNNGIKCRNTSESGKTRKHNHPISEATRQKMSDARKGKPRKSVYSYWLTKYGADEANKRLEEYKTKMSIIKLSKNEQRRKN